MKTVLSCIILAVALASSAYASPLKKACKAELADCKAKNDKAAHECLEAKEAHGQTDDGFSHGCYEAHERWEKKHGKMEKGESKMEKGEHHDEASETHE